MGKHWDKFREHVLDRFTVLGMILVDLVILLSLAAMMILIGREWVVGKIGTGSLLTRGTLLVWNFFLTLVL